MLAENPKAIPFTSCQSAKAGRKIHYSPMSDLVTRLPVISTEEDAIMLPVSQGGQTTRRFLRNAHFLTNKQ